MANQEVTTGEIMEVLGFIKDNMVMKAELASEMAGLRSEFKSDLGSQIGGLRSELRATELRMMDAMDEKLSNLKGDLTVMMRGEDKKVSTLIKMLQNKKLLSDEEAGSLLSLQPFPQT